MPTLVNADLVAEALLRFYREPVLHRAEMLRQNDVTGNLDLVVKLALGRPVGLSSPGLLGVGVAQELARASVFFVQQTLFRDGANHYQVLGLTPDATPEAIRENRRLLIQVVHPDRHNTPEAWPESVAARVNRAYSVLRNADARAAYDQQEAIANPAEESSPRAGPVFPAAAGANIRPRRPVPVSALPEWMTHGLGGFLRERPAVAIFGGLILLSVLAIGGVISSERDVTLTRDPAVADVAREPGPGNRVAIANPRDTARVTPVLPEATEVPAARTANPAAIALARLEGSIARRAAEQAPALVAVPVALPVALPVAQPVAQPVGVPVAVPVAASTAVASADVAPATAQSLPPQRSESVAPPQREAPPIGLAAQVQPPERTAPAVAALTTAIMATPAPTAAPAPAVASPPPAATPPPVTIVSVAAPGSVAAPIPTESVSEVLPHPPGAAEVEALIAALISNFEGGRLDAFAALFDVDVRTNEFRGRSAVRSEYNELFQRSRWRKMHLKQLRWRAVGERTEANGEMALTIGWRDGREVEQRIAVELHMVRRGDRAVIARFWQQVRN